MKATICGLVIVLPNLRRLRNRYHRPGSLGVRASRSGAAEITVNSGD
jgi:hypothetical protein